jgi:hypothetical protein
MDNKQFLQAYENKITIKDDILLVNGMIYTELSKDETSEVTIEYKLPAKTEAELIAKALDLTRKFYK